MTTQFNKIVSLMNRCHVPVCKGLCHGISLCIHLRLIIWSLELRMGVTVPLRWRHNGCDGVSYHQPHDCLLIRLFRRRSKKTSKLLVTGLCEGNSPVAGEFPAQMPSNTENVSIWWRHHGSAAETPFSFILLLHQELARFLVKTSCRLMNRGFGVRVNGYQHNRHSWSSCQWRAYKAITLSTVGAHIKFSLLKIEQSGFWEAVYFLVHLQ